MTKYTRATQEDIARIWKQLWGDLTREQVQEITNKENADEMAQAPKDESPASDPSGHIQDLSPVMEMASTTLRKEDNHGLHIQQ